jgi:hypothetical protein
MVAGHGYDTDGLASYEVEFEFKGERIEWL